MKKNPLKHKVSLYILRTYIQHSLDLQNVEERVAAARVLPIRCSYNLDVTYNIADHVCLLCRYSTTKSWTARTARVGLRRQLSTTPSPSWTRCPRRATRTPPSSCSCCETISRCGPPTCKATANLVTHFIIILTYEVGVDLLCQRHQAGLGILAAMMPRTSEVDICNISRPLLINDTTIECFRLVAIDRPIDVHSSVERLILYIANFITQGQ